MRKTKWISASQTALATKGKISTDKLIVRLHSDEFKFTSDDFDNPIPSLIQNDETCTSEQGQIL